MTQRATSSQIAIIGGGPAGLMAAEVAAAAGMTVTLFDRMPTVGRKFLMAGRGGLNITHSEPLDDFLARYGPASRWMTPHLHRFSPDSMRDWCTGLGQPTFIGSSGRVFPQAMKASPLLRAWLRRLEGQGVQFVTRANWTGWTGDGALCFADGRRHRADATVLALGGASWPKLGADGSWIEILRDVAVTALRPANCGFVVAWSERFRDRFAGTPLKSVALSFGDQSVRGDAMVTVAGLEGGAVYALAAPLRDQIQQDGAVELRIDLRPDLSHNAVSVRLNRPRGAASLSNFLRKQVGLSPIAIALLQESLHDSGLADVSLADRVKSLPVRLTATCGLARSISTAGGLARTAVDDNLMVMSLPGLFVAGEMLDWEAPTGGYLLQGCFATGATAGAGAVAWIKRNAPSDGGGCGPRIENRE